MSPEAVNDQGQHEVEMVLSALRGLQKKVTSPIIRTCLESARDDIVLLMGRGEDADDELPCSPP